MHLIAKLIEKLREGTLREIIQESVWIYGYAKQYRLAIIIYIILGLLGTAVGLGSGLASKSMIDMVTGQLIDSAAAQDTSSMLSAVAFYVGFGLAGIVFSCISSRVSAIINLKVQNEIRADVYQKFIYTDWISLQSYHSGDLLNRINGDVMTVSGSVLGWIPSLITCGVQFLGALGVILYFDPAMAAIALMSAPVSLLLSRILVKRMREFQLRSRECSSALMSFFEESLQNLQAVKSFGLVSTFCQKLGALQKKYIDLSLDYNKFSVFTSAVLSLTGLMVSYACFGWGVYRVWSGVISLGTMVLFIQLSSTLSSALSSLISLVPNAVSATVAARRIITILEMPRESMDGEAEVQQLARSKDGISVTLSGVDFGYRAHTPVLCGVQFRAHPGEIVALVGPSGGGKTTFLRILLGLVVPQAGQSELRSADGHSVSLCPAARPLFSYVPQEKTIFSGTIADTLRLIAPEATDEQLWEALRLACADAFVQKLPEQLYAPIGERGCSLSEGQNQRLSIARALLADSPILLLDEATSALDVATERQVLRNIMRSDARRTCIVTTHRPSVLTMCTRVYRIEDTQVTIADADEVQRLMQEF